MAYIRNQTAMAVFADNWPARDKHEWSTTVIKNVQLVTMALTCLGLLSACGELAYKRGGQPAELEEVQNTCRNSPKPGETYEQCMTSHGWTVRNLELEPLVVATSANPDNRVAPQAVADVLAPMTSPIPNQVKPAVVATTPAKPEDPMELLKVNSVWKFGGTPTELESATEKCVAKLGDKHRPVMSPQQLMTRAMVRCLRDQGWYAAFTR